MELLPENGFCSFNKDWNGKSVGVIGGRKPSGKHTMALHDVEGGGMVSCVTRERNAPTHVRSVARLTRKGSFTIIDIYESVHSVRFLMTPSPLPKSVL